MWRDTFFGREINRIASSNSMVNKIILVNVLVFIVTGLISLLSLIPSLSFTANIFDRWLGMPVQWQQLIYKPWTLVTNLFMHAGIWHLLTNMLVMYWFGKVIEEFLGSKKVLPLFIYGGLAGNVLYLITANLIPVFHNNMMNAYLIGASGAVMALVVAAATLTPNYTFMLPFFSAVKIAWIALFYVLLDLIALPAMASGSDDGVGHFAHLGGAAFGYFFIRQLQKGNDWSIGFNKLVDWLVGLTKPRGPKISYKNSSNQKQKIIAADDQQKKLDTILDKISQSGYEGLTASEKEFLFRYSKKN